MRRSILTCLILFAMSSSLLAQSEDEVEDTFTQIEHSSHVSIGIEAATKLVYAGRFLGVKGPVFSTRFEYQHKSGVYGFCTPNIWTDKTILKRTLIPDIETGLGFKRSFEDVFYMDISFSHDFITYGNTAFKKSFSNSLSLETETNLGNLVNVGVNGFIAFTKNKKNIAKDRLASNINVYVSKDVAFYNLLGAKRFLISPSIGSYVGSDNLANTKSNAIKDQQGTPVVKYVYDNFWGLLDVEASTALEWRTNHVLLGLTPTYILPFNPELNNRKNQTGKGIFYLSLEAKFYLFKKNLE